MGNKVQFDEMFDIVCLKFSKDHPGYFAENKHGAWGMGKSRKVY